MPAARTGLVSLIDDLMQDRDVRTRFNRAPARIAQEYGLTPVELAALFRMTPADIAKAVGVALSAYQLNEAEFPRDSPEFFPIPGEPDPQYPSPIPHAFRFLPTTIARPVPPPPPHTSFELRVLGQSFMPGDTTIDLVPSGGGASLVVSDPRSFGTFRCCGVRAFVEYPAAAGSFEVWVLSPATARPPTFPTSNRFRATNTVLTIT